MRVHQIPVFDDNFIYILVDEQTSTAAVVDPGTAKEAISYLKKENLTLTTIFNTHHHNDHVGGNHELIQAFKNVSVYASVQDKSRIPGQTVFLNHHDTVTFGGEMAHVYFVPGHTRGHIAYHFKNQNYLFIGDTLFSGGCGKLFEGTYLEMFTSLKFLRDHVPNDTVVFCAHEYTLRNYSIFAALEVNNLNLQEKLKRVTKMREQNQFTVSFVFSEEKKLNPFLRWDDVELKKVTGTKTDIETFTYLRQYRDQF